MSVRWASTPISSAAPCATSSSGSSRRTPTSSWQGWTCPRCARRSRRQMREESGSVARVSGERIGGGLAADGMGELSRLLLGSQPRRALELARDTGVLVELLPEFAAAVGFDQESRYHALAVDAHIF